MLYCQGQLEKLEELFDKVEKVRLQYPKVGMMCLAMVNTELEDGSSEDVFLRGRIQGITENQASAQSLLSAYH